MIINETYYDILEIKEKADKKEIKNQYRKLSKIYHPDKNNGDYSQFLKVKEAYDTLYDTEKRKLYDINLFFKELDFTEEDYKLLKKYYNNIISSQEYKLMKLLYNSIPKKVKSDLWNKFRGYNINNKIVKAQKSIDITGLHGMDQIINLCIPGNDYENDVLKIIYILSNNGIYYLYLRKHKKQIIIDNLSCYLIINFFIVH